jgi:hypothetical protein
MSISRRSSPCRKTEPIELLERAVCSCVELLELYFSEAETKHVSRCARFQQHRDASFHEVCIQQGKAPKEINSIL